MEQNHFEWPEYVMHFGFGAFVGFVLSGVVVWWLADIFQSWAWWVVGISTLVFALLGAGLKDRLWKALGESPLFRLWSRIFS